MNTSWKGRTLALVVAAVVVTLVVVGVMQPVNAQKDGGAAGGATYPRYSVMDTEGHNLIVTDNKTNTLYFYTVDKDQPIGSDLKLRGTLDLTQVGKPVIKPTKTKSDKAAE